MFARLAAALAVATTLLASPAHAATTAPPAEVAAFVVSAPAAVPAGALGYTVQRGDTLGRIAARYCGTTAAYRSIGAASGVANYDLIFPGQHLRILCTGGKPAPKAKSAPKTTAAPTAVLAAAGSAGPVVAFAEAQVGKRYVWATAGPGSYDCSGLIMAAYARIGVRLPHQSGGIAGYGRPVSGALQPGDVLFLSDRAGHVYHVILYVGGGQIVEAASPGQGVIRHAVYPYSFARRLV